MNKYILNRLFQLIPLLIGVSIISFFVMHLAPGDPTALFINPNVDPLELARVRANWGLDQPYIFLWYPKVISGVRDRVGGLSSPGPAGLFLNLEKVYVIK